MAPLVDSAQPTDKIGQKRANARHQLQAKPTHTAAIKQLYLTTRG